MAVKGESPFVRSLDKLTEGLTATYDRGIKRTIDGIGSPKKYARFGRFILLNGSQAKQKIRIPAQQSPSFERVHLEETALAILESQGSTNE
jgi:hypothetical protein